MPMSYSVPLSNSASSDNAIPIKSWFNDPSDTALLNLLPVLDALRLKEKKNRPSAIVCRGYHPYFMASSCFFLGSPQTSVPYWTEIVKLRGSGMKETYLDIKTINLSFAPQERESVSSRCLRLPPPLSQDFFHPDPSYGVAVDPKTVFGPKPADLEFITRGDIHADSKFLTKKI